MRRGIVPVLILLAAMGATAGGLLPVPIAFFAAAVAMVLFRVIPLREVYAAIDGPILVMLAALIPVSDSLAHAPVPPTSSPDGSPSSAPRCRRPARWR